MEVSRLLHLRHGDIERATVRVVSLRLGDIDMRNTASAMRSPSIMDDLDKQRADHLADKRTTDRMTPPLLKKAVAAAREKGMPEADIQRALAREKPTQPQMTEKRILRPRDPLAPAKLIGDIATGVQADGDSQTTTQRECVSKRAASSRRNRR
jgi:hypothetical protein